MHKFLLVIDATTRSQQFKQMNERRPIAAIPFFAKYKLVDFGLSSGYHAECDNVGVFTKDSARSLRDHLGGGKFWNLDRNRGGLFILPSSLLDIPYEPMIAYQRLRDHIELLHKSYHHYVIVVNGYAVHNLDFQKLLNIHIESGLDLSVVKKGQLNTGIYISTIEVLQKLTLSAPKTGDLNLADTVLNPKEVTVNTIQIYKPFYLIESLKDYYHVSMELLNNVKTRNEIFKVDRPIITKEHQTFPAHICEHAIIKHSIIETGSVIHGNIERSILFHKVNVGEGSLIEDSIVFTNSRVGENVTLKFVVVDKDVTIDDGVTLTGTKTEPLYIPKKSHIKGNLS